MSLITAFHDNHFAKRFGMPRIGKRMRCRPKSLLYWAIIITFFYFLKPLFLPLEISIHSWSFTDHDKCPACFGESLCPDLYHDKVVLTDWTRYTVSRLFNSKNVFHARHFDTPAILKKLGSSKELRDLDIRICDLADKSKDIRHCKGGHYIKALTEHFSVKESAEPKLDHEKLSQHVTNTEALDCVSSQRLVDILTERSRFHRTTTSIENVLTMLMVNPEPVIFMAFPPEDGWPFPSYLGSCGRLAAFENAGTMLTDYYTEPWETRVQIGRQLLEMSIKFTENDSKIALYLTDWSPDNFVVDQFGKVTLIDGENIILVDQKHLIEQKPPGWNVKHTSGGFPDCEKRFCYASDELCTHQVSDHNLYGVCKGLLAEKSLSPLMPNGLLHGIPKSVSRKHPLFGRLIQECAQPSHPGGRFEAADQLLEILKLI